MSLYDLILEIRGRFPAIRGRLIRSSLSCDRLQIGRRFKCEQGVALTVRKGCSLIVGDDVEIRRDVEIRVSGAARVTIGSNVRLDRGVRIIATNSSKVDIGDNVRIGLHSVLNAGDSLSIGEKSLISGFVYLQTSMHQHSRAGSVQDQGFSHSPIVLGCDVWIGSHATVLPGVSVKAGAVVGSTAVVTRDVNEFSVVAGVPARVLKYRV